MTFEIVKIGVNLFEFNFSAKFLTSSSSFTRTGAFPILGLERIFLIVLIVSS